MKFQVDIKQLILNNVATVRAEDLTQMYSYSVQQKSALLGLVCFMKNNALPEHHITAELCWNVDFSIGELDRIHSDSFLG